MTDMAGAILSALIAIAPPETLPQFPGHEETREVTLTRYASIAGDIEFAVVEGCAGRPDEKQCQRRSSAMLLGTAKHESRFAADVDHGNCFHGVWRGWDYHRRCDGDKSRSVWQIQYGTPEELLLWKTNRHEAARGALRLIRQSMKACRRHGNEGLLAAYADGNCESSMGLFRARELWGSTWAAEKALPLW